MNCVIYVWNSSVLASFQRATPTSNTVSQLKRDHTQLFYTSTPLNDLTLQGLKKPEQTICHIPPNSCMQYPCQSQTLPRVLHQSLLASQVSGEHNIHDLPDGGAVAVGVLKLEAIAGEERQQRCSCGSPRFGGDRPSQQQAVNPHRMAAPQLDVAITGGERRANEALGRNPGCWLERLQAAVAVAVCPPYQCCAP